MRECGIIEAIIINRSGDKMVEGFMWLLLYFVGMFTIIYFTEAKAMKQKKKRILFGFKRATYLTIFLIICSILGTIFKFFVTYL